MDEVSLARLERDARTRLSKNAALSYATIGGIAALRGDSSGVVDAYGKSLNLDNSMVNQYNYAVSLSIVGDYKRSLAAIAEVIVKYPDELDALRFALVASTDAGAFDYTKECVQRLMKLNQPIEPAFRALLSAFDSGLLSESDAQAMLGILTEIQLREGAICLTVALLRDETEPDVFVYERQVFVGTETAAKMNLATAERLADNHQLLETSLGRLVPMFVGARIDGG